MNAKNLRWFALACACAAPLAAAIVGTNPPALPLTAGRIASLPAAAQPAWRDYHARSGAQRAADQKFLTDEIAAHHVTAAVTPAEGRNSSGVPLNRPAAWYATAEARRMADNVVSFQTPAGGWSKNFNAADHARRPGEGFSHDNVSRFLAPGDNDTPADLHWNYIGTFDNDATTTQLRFIAKVAAAADAKTGAAWRAAFAHGLDYIFAAQYPNGGWPQVWPLDGGYHDSITFNDGAMIHVLELLRDAGSGKDEFAIVSADTRTRATAALARGIACVLAAQIVVDGRRTVWCQQHDALTLAPSSARNYEMPSQSASESAGVMTFLMALPAPGPPVVAAVHAAAAWFRQTALRDVAYRQAPDGSGRALLKVPGAGPLWPRYAEIGTNRPIFGDRDKSIHDDVTEISKERRNGYQWFGDAPKRALEHYATWAKRHPAR